MGKPVYSKRTGRKELLQTVNENWFMSLEDARCKIEAWRIHYNQRRPHSALGWMTPSEFAEKSAGCLNMQPT
ncbi:TPA: transposase [Raoultella planticola]|jgi:putative transposase|nr:hypothetical protein CRN13_03285 [Raoultella ornithinolytica]MBE0015576.1 transposase [Raoultella planticola]QLP50044.1 transposase [Klebsiella michiganensis]HCG2918803.1 transposase [Klebsiella pneumoniae]HAT2374088.1 transposase [Raoultella ornithinolytica]